MKFKIRINRKELMMRNVDFNELEKDGRFDKFWC